MNIRQGDFSLVRNSGLVGRQAEAYLGRVTGSAFLVTGYVPVALSKSEGAGSVVALAILTGAHLFKQVLGNTELKRLQWARHTHIPKNSKSMPLRAFCSATLVERTIFVLHRHADEQFLLLRLCQQAANDTCDQIKHGCSPSTSIKWYLTAVCPEDIHNKACFCRNFRQVTPGLQPAREEGSPAAPMIILRARSGHLHHGKPELHA